MRFRPVPPLALCGLLLACAPYSPPGQPAAAQAPPAAGPERVALPREADPDDPLCAPLLLEDDPGFGTHVVMRRVPTAADLDQLSFISGLRQVVIALPRWPATYAELRPIQEAILPEGVELVVLLPGWPPTREALGAWNLVGANLRLILLVDGPPADRVRALDRVVAQMEHPARSGFERLQRPLSFRVLFP
jgi:hypothetical protein